jgi:hypothetical protein
VHYHLQINCWKKPSSCKNCFLQYVVKKIDLWRHWYKRRDWMQIKLLMRDREGNTMIHLKIILRKKWTQHGNTCLPYFVRVVIMWAEIVKEIITIPADSESVIWWLQATVFPRCCELPDLQNMNSWTKSVNTKKYYWHMYKCIKKLSSEEHGNFDVQQCLPTLIVESPLVSYNLLWTCNLTIHECDED